MSRRRIVVPTTAIAGERAVITGPLCHYLSHVLRLRQGAELVLVDGSGASYEGHVHRFTAREVEVRISRRHPPGPTPTPRLVLVYGMSRRTRTEWVLQKTTELGIDLVLPAATTRSVSRITDRTGRKLERWNEIVAEAARQSGRRTLPLLAAPQPLDAALAQAAETADVRLLATPRGEPLAEHGQAIGARDSRCVAMAVGAEGGFTPEEEDLAREHGFSPVNLGPLVLRTETAALAMVSVVAHLAGRLHAPPADPR